MLTTAGTSTTVYSHEAFTSKVKCFSVHAMKAYRGSRGTAPLTHNFATAWRWVARFTLQPSSGQNPRYPEWVPETVWTVLGNEGNIEKDNTV
jgi:hypothetical protein